MTVTIPSDKIGSDMARRDVARRNPSRITPDRLEAARTGMATQAVTSILADMLLGRIDAVDSVSDLLRLAAHRLQRRVDEL